MVTLADLEKLHVLQAIVDCNYDLEIVAGALGVSKRTLYRMLKRWKLPSPIGGRPETTLWSEHLKRCTKITKVISELSLAKGEK